MSLSAKKATVSMRAQVCLPANSASSLNRLEKATNNVFAKTRKKTDFNRISSHVKEDSPSSFSVQEISDKNKSYLSTTCREWRMRAAQYFDLISLTEIEEKRLIDSLVIMETLSNSITSSSRIFSCKYENKLEAIALITDKGTSLELELLASNPKNLVSQPDSVKGSGTAFLHFLFHKCIYENKDSIELYSRRSSVEFYKKMGFFVVDAEAEQDESQNIRMSISAERIQEILFRCQFSP